MSGRRLNHQRFSTFLQNQSSGEGGSKKSTTSSTKEIARKAVEDEWKRNQKRKRSGHGGDSSDEEEDRRDSGKHQRKSQKNEEEEDDSFEFSQDYRDRAKERREGNPPADTASETKEESVCPTDPALPPPTKGLDLSLARKLRKEMKETGMKRKNDIDGEAQFTELPTMEQATSTLESIISQDAPAFTNSSIDSNTLDYIEGLIKFQHQAKQPHPAISCTLAGKKMQLSRLVVNLNGSISDLKRSWEIPREVTNSNPFSNIAQPCLDLILIEKIETVLKPMKKSHYPITSTTNKRTIDISTQPIDEVEAGQTSPQSIRKSTKQRNEADVSDDDDDIFGGLDDYVPPAPKRVKQ